VTCGEVVIADKQYETPNLSPRAKKPSLCCPVLHYLTEEEMDTVPLEVSSAFVAIAAGGLLILAGYIFNKWRK
jgi:hypothetical protein